MVKPGQRDESDAKLNTELEKTRRRITEYQEFSGKGDASPQCGVLPEHCRTCAEALGNEIPDEITTDEKRPVIDQLDSYYYAEHDDQDACGKERIYECPKKPEDGALIFHLKISDYEAPE